MLTTRVIPCLDTRDGRVVKGIRFQSLRDAGNPEQLALAYELQGADELVLLDVTATLEGRRTRLQTLRRVREQISIPLTTGGGVRNTDDAMALLEAGADKVAVNSAAVADPALIGVLAVRFGCQCVVLALDAVQVSDERWEVIVHSGRMRTSIDAIEWAAQAVQRGAGEILLTSWDRDGTRSGYDLDLIRAVSRAVRVPVIASGGAAGPRDLLAAVRAGAAAVLAASIFHYGQYTVGDVKHVLADAGVNIRS